MEREQTKRGRKEAGVLLGENSKGRRSAESLMGEAHRRSKVR